MRYIDFVVFFSVVCQLVGLGVISVSWLSV